MRPAFLYPAILGSVLLQMTIFDRMSIFWVRADLILLMLACACVYLPFRQAVVCGIVCGILKDVLVVQQTAWYTLMLPIWSIVLWKLARKVSVDDRFLLAGFILLFILAHNIAMSMAMSFLSSGIPAGISMRITILEAFYTATLAALCYRPLKRLILS